MISPEPRLTSFGRNQLKQRPGLFAKVCSAVKHLGSNPRQIFVVGFSAGGGMAAAMLAAYPALFSAGAVVAGMPVGCASTVFGAMLRMRRTNVPPSRQALAEDVRRAAPVPTRKSWPRISIWHGERDHTVDPSNADELAAQWSELHGFDPEPLTDREESTTRRRAWGRMDRPAAVELWTFREMGHGFPIDAKSPDCGHPGMGMIDIGLCAARQIVSFWDLEPSV